MVDFHIDMSTTLELYDEFERIVHYHGKLVEVDVDGKRRDQIGWFRMTHAMLYDQLIMDGASTELNSVYLALCSLEDYEALGPLSVWYMDRLVVQRQYRGRGVGSNCLYRLLRHVSNGSGMDAFVICAAPLDDDGTPLSQIGGASQSTINVQLHSLRRFYSNLGLKELLLAGEGPLDDQHWFYYNLEYRLPPPPLMWEGIV